MASGLPLLTAAITNPTFVVLRPYESGNSYVSYKDGSAVINDLELEEGVYSPLVKIEVEIGQKVEAGKKFVHLRFCHSNRYIGRREGSETPVAELKQPDEDMKKATSTLFEMRNAFDSPDSYYFCHVQSQTFLQLNEARDTLQIKKWPDTTNIYFELVDWDSLVKLPKHVAFKGDNGKYLRGYWIDDLCYIQYGSGDPNHTVSRNEVELLPNGYVKIKCLHWSKYWRNGDCWIWADSDSSSITDKSLLFWPVKLDDNTIALRSAMNDNFCSRLTADFKDDCLNAHSPTITTETKLVVQELVLERKITNVSYQMQDARIFDEKPYIAGSTSAVNESDKEASVAVTIGCTTTNSYSFSRSISLTAGVKATIEANLLEIVKASLEYSFEISASFEWGESKTYEKAISATGTITVPPKSRAIVNYVGTIGTCNVPYHYKRQDKSSTDGKIYPTDEIDGVYTGVNAYNFSFQVQNYEPL